jgi:hypothetical protein
MVAHTASIEEFTKLSSDQKEKLWKTVKKHKVPTHNNKF